MNCSNIPLKQLAYCLAMLLLVMFNVKPAAAADTTRFQVLSHCYPNIFDGKTEDLKALQQAFLSKDIDFVAFNGDLIPGTFHVDQWRNGDFSDMNALKTELEAQWSLFESYMVNPRGIPVYYAPGNHDISSYTPEYRKVVRSVYLERHGATHQVAKWGDWLMLFISSIDENGSYRVGKKNFTLLKKALEAYEGPKMIFIHHPLWYLNRPTNPGNTHPTNSNQWWQQIHPLLIQHNVKAVFGGDAGTRQNYFMEDAYDGIRYYLNGSGREGFSWLEIQITNESVEVNPHLIPMKTEHVIPDPDTRRVSIFKKIGNALAAPFLWLGLLCGGIIIFVLSRVF